MCLGILLLFICLMLCKPRIPSKIDLAIYAQISNYKREAIGKEMERAREIVSFC